MKSKLSFFVVVLLSAISITFAGTPKPIVGNVTVFSELGDKFTLYINNVIQNTEPSVEATVKDVKGATILLKIVFENTAIIPIVNKIARQVSKDVIYAITKDPKGNYFIKIASKVAVPMAVATQPVVLSKDSTLKIDTLVSIPLSSQVKPVTSENTAPAKPTPSTQPSSNVLINGQPAQTTITTSNTGTPILKAENNTGSITIDPSKEYHSPTIAGVPAEKFGDALGDAFDQAFNGKPATNQQQTTTTPTTATATQPTVATSTHPAAIGAATFFSDTGEKFTLLFNGVQANVLPLSNVVVNNVSVIRFTVNIVFQDTTIAPINKTMMRMGKDCTYTIKKNKKGEFVLKLTSSSGAL
jgi:hypothetical protein